MTNNTMLTDVQFWWLMNHPDLGLKRRISVPHPTIMCGNKIVRCNKCETCVTRCISAKNACLNCKDKTRFGGFNIRKQACEYRPKCLSPVLIEWINPKFVNELFACI